MKWFQLDSDAPEDPRVRAVLAHFGNAGLGALLRLWCFVANHGKHRAGWSLDSQGKPIPKAILIEATGTTEPEFDLLLSTLVQNGHVLKNPWKNRGIVVLPAMSRRADTYTHRKSHGVRTNFEHSSNNVHLQTNKQTNISTNTSTGAKKRAAKSSALTRAKPPHEKPNRKLLQKLVWDCVEKTPPAERDFANLKDLAKQVCAQWRIPYDGLMVAKAVEAALAVKAKRA